MSKFFRSPDSSDSSSTSSSDEDQDESLDIRQRQIASINSPDTRNVSQGSDGSLESITPHRAASTSESSLHRDFLLHALLEERCMNEVMQERGGSGLRRTSHELRMMQDEARVRYERLCAKLAPLNLVTTGLDHERHRPVRQKYRDGLDVLRKGSIATGIGRNGVPAPVRKLLMEGSVGLQPESASKPTGIDERVASSSIVDAFAPLSQLFVPSQYLRDFEELGMLGKGGYGRVYHAKHRLDGLTYAVKKVPVRQSIMARIQAADGQAALDEILIELRTLAKLDHPNVVRYFNSWIEWSTDTNSAHYSDDTMSNAEFSSVNWLDQPEDRLETSSALHRVVTQSGMEEDIGITFESRSNQFSGRSDPRFAAVSDDVTSISATDGALCSSSEPGPTLALHMQMGIYPMTLQDFLMPQPTSGVTPLAHCFHPEPSIAILLAIIDGVEYLHSEGIIHRDLKPANIFMRLETNPRSNRGYVNLSHCAQCRSEKRANPAAMSVRIGDFGLVSQIAHSGDNTLHPAVGTEIYRPTGDTARISPRLDIFALGIIAFELMWKFNTQMERRETLVALKKGTYPPHFARYAGERWSQLQECINDMLSIERVESPVTFDDLRLRFSSMLTP